MSKSVQKFINFFEVLRNIVKNWGVFPYKIFSLATALDIM